ncbi:MAG: type II secretion system protein [Opitutaceae bacterium]
MKRSKDLNGEGHATFLNAFSYDLLVTCIILGALACFAVHSTLSGMKKAEITAALGRASNYKKAVMVYYSIHGHMPESEEAIEDAGIYEMWGNPKDRYDTNYAPIEIEEGAIHLPLNKDSDATLSWRPAVLRSNPTGSIVWVIGDYFNANRLQAFGEDRTSLSHQELHSIYYIN